MCPRGQTRFFFTVNNIQIASDNFPLLVMEDPIIKVKYKYLNYFNNITKRMFK